MEQKRVRMGIIGIGNMGSGHVKSFIEGEVSDDVVLTAVADLRKSRREWAKEYFRKNCTDIVVFDDDVSLIESGLCDAVMVEIPHYDHPAVSIRAWNTDYMYYVRSLQACMQNRSGR